MDERPRSPSVPRWRAKLVQAPLEPQNEPVALMVNVNHDPHVWARGSSEIRPVPNLDRRMPPLARDISVAGGRWLLFVREVWSEDESLPYLERTIRLGICRYEVATGQIQRAGFDPLPRPVNSVHFNASPDGQRVLATQDWTDPPELPKPTRDQMRCTLSFADFTSTPAREILTITGYAHGDADDLPVQWSPDGTKIAVALSYSQGEQALPRDRVLILDAQSGAEITSVDDVALAGSVSWSPDSQQLLTADFSRTLWTYDLATGQREPIAVLPGPRPGTWVNGSPRLLGFADEHRVLVAVQRRTTMTISALHLDTAASEGLLR